VLVGDAPTVFPTVCHACGGCALVCPAGAVEEKDRAVGAVERGLSGDTAVVTGVLNVGEASGVGVIRAALRAARKMGADHDLTVIDCPPGSACTVIESVRDADYCLLVAEPTAFGFSNFKMVHELVTVLKKPCGVVVNKDAGGYAPLEEYLAAHALSVLARIPYDARLARAGAQAQIICRQDEAYRALFTNMRGAISARVGA